LTESEIIFKSDVDVELIECMGTDARIAEAARVSTVAESASIEIPEARVAGLINFLMRDRHGTPFEHNSFTFRVSAPLFVFHEFQRHRIGWSYNEESGRYRKLDPVFYVPRSDRALRQIGKPGAYTFEPGDYQQQAVAQSSAKRAARYTWEEYQYQLEHGIAKEVARDVLSVSLYKTMYATCNLRSLFSFLSLRWAHPNSTVPTFPLDEIKMVAEKLDALARTHFPLAFTAFDEHGRVAP
jgi:thymidylate synthase (FAD)